MNWWRRETPLRLDSNASRPYDSDKGDAPLIRLQYTCDECGKYFGRPVWHCPGCGNHNSPDIRTCKCGEVCAIPKEWFQSAAREAHRWKPPEKEKKREAPKVIDKSGLVRSYVQRLARIRGEIEVSFPKESKPITEKLLEIKELLQQIRLPTPAYGRHRKNAGDHSEKNRN